MILGLKVKGQGHKTTKWVWRWLDSLSGCFLMSAETPAASASDCCRELAYSQHVPDWVGTPLYELPSQISVPTNDDSSETAETWIYRLVDYEVAKLLCPQSLKRFTRTYCVNDWQRVMYRADLRTKTSNRRRVDLRVDYLRRRRASTCRLVAAVTRRRLVFQRRVAARRHRTHTEPGALLASL